MSSLRLAPRLVAVVATHLTAASVLALSLGGSAQAVSIDWVTVGDPGNACDVQSQGCFGAVAYTYQIGKYQVTNAQYAEFLNAVAATDTNGLYYSAMHGSSYGGISRSGSPGSYTYSVKSGFADNPVNFVSFWNSLRFANWLENGQPTGAQDATTTEDGAYTITPEGIAANSITRNPESTIFLASEDEWYKAAYYDTVLDIYYDYPYGTDTPTTCEAPPGGTNSASCEYAVSPLGSADVGSYTQSVSPFGTFDQGGNVWEWTEAINGPNRIVKGAGWNYKAFYMEARIRFNWNPSDPDSSVGIRLAMIPEPSTALLLGFGLAGLAVQRRGFKRAG